MSQQGSTPSRDFASRIHRTELANGAALLVVENAASPIVSLRGSLRAGSFFDPLEKPGLARLTAEMLERGSLHHSKLEIAGALEAVGAELEFSADTFTVEIAGRALAQNVQLLLATLGESLREPSFPADELEKLKQQTIAALQEQQTNTRYRAYERLTQLIFAPTNPFYLPDVEHLIESIKTINVEDIKDFYAEHYGARSLILSIAGRVQADFVSQLFSGLFADFAGPRAATEIEVTDPLPQNGLRREIVELKEKANVDVLLGSAAPLRRDSPDYYSALLANNALGESTLSSRLGLVVRDREGLTYGISSRFRAPSLAAGPWYVTVSVNPHNVPKAIDSALGVLREYVLQGITPDELANEKSSAVGSFKVSLANTSGIAEALWEAEFYGLGVDYIDRFGQMIERVTKEEVNDAIRKFFRPDDLTIVMAGDFNEALLAGHQ